MATLKAHRRLQHLLHGLALSTLALAITAAPRLAQAEPGPSPTRAKSSKSGKRQNAGPRNQIREIRSSSEETPAQRDRRLYRECQGRPNAGACAGYTQKPPGGRPR